MTLLYVLPARERVRCFDEFLAFVQFLVRPELIRGLSQNNSACSCDNHHCDVMHNETETPRVTETEAGSACKWTLKLPVLLCRSSLCLLRTPHRNNRLQPRATFDAVKFIVFPTNLRSGVNVSSLHQKRFNHFDVVVLGCRMQANGSCVETATR